MTSFEVPLASARSAFQARGGNPYLSYGRPRKNANAAAKRGRGGIEPPTSPTRRENHTSRPTARPEASNEDRTRDLVLTRHMLCQLSYRGDSVAPGRRVSAQTGPGWVKKSAKEEHTRRDSNPQPPDSKSGALSIAPRGLLHMTGFEPVSIIMPRRVV